MKTDAIFSDCRQYRFALWRTWNEQKPYAMIIGLNPSTADESKNDPTITRCINFAQAWGYGGLCMVNLFAYRATVPAVMMAAKEPVGADNDQWLSRLASDAGIVVAAWGNDGRFLDRSAQVKDLLSDLHCLKMNKSGEPAHPLYLKAELKPLPMR